VFVSLEQVLKVAEVGVEVVGQRLQRQAIQVLKTSIRLQLLQEVSVQSLRHHSDGSSQRVLVIKVQLENAAGFQRRKSGKLFVAANETAPQSERHEHHAIVDRNGGKELKQIAA